MSPVRVTFRRTVGMARGLYTTALALAGFLAAAAALHSYMFFSCHFCSPKRLLKIPASTDTTIEFPACLYS